MVASTPNVSVHPDSCSRWKSETIQCVQMEPTVQPESAATATYDNNEDTPQADSE